MQMKSKKADASVVILVFLCIALFAYAGYTFNLNKNQIVSEIIDVQDSNIIYLKEGQLDFYINEAIDDTLKQGYSGKEGFVDVLKKNLRKYDKEDILVSEEILRIIESLDVSNVQFKDEIVVSIDTVIVDNHGKIITTYNYRGLFIR